MGRHVFSCRSLLLSTTILNDTFSVLDLFKSLYSSFLMNSCNGGLCFLTTYDNISSHDTM